MGENEVDPVLCYVDGSFAFFTTQAIEQQWGDDWDDAPYEHNAGDPYGPVWHRELKHRKGGELCACSTCERDWDGDKPRWRILKVGWEGPFIAPDFEHVNSRYCVRDINRGAIAWLRPDYGSNVHPIAAGTPLSEFTERVLAAGGTVYLPVSSDVATSPAISNA
jgi:hypothetical protein